MPATAAPPDLTAEIVRLHDQITSALRTSLAHAIRIGELLTEHKARLEHGQFTDWAKQHLPFTLRTAQNYMRVYRERETIKNEKVAFLGAAYDLTALRKNGHAPEQNGKPSVQQRTRKSPDRPREPADDPPETYTLKATKDDKEKLDRLISYLGEKVFHGCTDSTAVVLAALEFAKERASA